MKSSINSYDGLHLSSICSGQFTFIRRRKYKGKNWTYFYKKGQNPSSFCVSISSQLKNKQLPYCCIGIRNKFMYVSSRSVSEHL